MWLDSTGTSGLPPSPNDPTPGGPTWFPPGPIDHAGRYPSGWYIEEGGVLRGMTIFGQAAGDGDHDGQATLQRRRRRGVESSYL